MVKFDSRTAGTSAAAWQESSIVRDAAPLSIRDVSRAIVVAAHADDETLGAGGLIASLAGAGVELAVVIVTDGAGSHPDSATHTSQQVARLRRDEAITAIGNLAPAAQVYFLGVADGTTPGATADIRRGIADQLRDVDLIVATWRGDGHRDHRVVGEICAELAGQRGIRLLEYPIWMWHWGSPYESDAEEVPGSLAWVAHSLAASARSAKSDALRAYRSQVDGLGDAPGDGPVLDSHFLANFEGLSEFFIETATVGTHGDDLGEPYFDELYRHRSDPWSLESRWYERRKRSITMAALPAERYRSALEIGSSIGMLTSELARRCDNLLSLDISAAAVEQARARLVGSDHVRIEHRDAVADFPAGQFDLIVISEVGYYWPAEVLERVAVRAAAALSADGVVVLCHWRHPVEGYVLSGDAVHRIVRGAVDLKLVAAHQEADFLLDVLARDPRSVAQLEGFIS
jgi:LmbE family N-acetylglucosaminyl deacetylase/SAM-dependent methyltransferase